MPNQLHRSSARSAGRLRAKSSERMPAKEAARLHQLLEKGSDGRLSATEERELNEALAVIDQKTIVMLARQAMAQSARPAPKRYRASA